MWDIPSRDCKACRHRKQAVLTAHGRDLLVKGWLSSLGGGAGFGLIGRSFASEFALPCYSFVGFGYALDPVLELAASVGQLLGYHVADAGRPPIREAANVTL
jgi:hypothetical protein